MIILRIILGILNSPIRRAIKSVHNTNCIEVQILYANHPINQIITKQYYITHTHLYLYPKSSHFQNFTPNTYFYTRGISFYINKYSI